MAEDVTGDGVLRINAQAFALQLTQADSALERLEKAASRARLRFANLGPMILQSEDDDQPLVLNAERYADVQELLREAQAALNEALELMEGGSHAPSHPRV